MKMRKFIGSASLSWSIAVTGFLAGGLSWLGADQFNVNFYGSFGTPPSGWQEIVTLTPTQVAGVSPWTSTGWHNISATQLTSTTLNSEGGNTATIEIKRTRNAGSYSRKELRDSSTHDDGHASLLDSHMNATEDPADQSNIGIIELRDIPYAAYDLVVYFGIQRAQGFDGKGLIRLNDQIEKSFVVDRSTPDWTYTRMTDILTPGNYMVFPGLSGDTLNIEVWGEGFTHLGPSGLQVVEAPEARKPFKINLLALDPSQNEFSITWNSVPGDAYSMAYTENLVDFYPLGSPVIPANPSGFTSTLDSITNPKPGAEKLFIRVGPADYLDPVWERVSGIGNIVTLDFSEPLLEAIALDPSNYSILDQSSNPVPIQMARSGPTNEMVELVLDQALDPNSDYTVSVSSLIDPAGRSLSNPQAKSFKTWDDQPGGVKVFILAGQSNMVGFGSTEVGNGSVVGAIGSLRYLVNNQPEKYGDLVDTNGAWASREDVKFWWARNQVITGNLTVGYGSNSERFGPEYGFGQVIGDHFEEPVLIIKTAWGGKSLSVDFRPPSAVKKRGGEVGRYYYDTLSQAHQVLDQFATEFPEWADLGYEIVGFAWHQGWNDSFNASSVDEYLPNLVDLIDDMRTAFGKPLLPFSLASTGHGGMNQSTLRGELNSNQLKIADPSEFPEFSGNVSAADTRPFWRESNVSPRNEFHHWNWNAETFYQIGESLGEGMKSLLPPAP